MLEKKKRKIFPLLFLIGGLIFLVLLVLFFMMRKNNVQQGEKIVILNLNGAVIQPSSLPETDSTDLSLAEEASLSTVTLKSQSDATTEITSLTLGAAPEKVESLLSDEADDSGFPLRGKVASVSAYDGVVRFYFALDKSNVADGSRNALDKLINEAKGKRYLVISPFYEGSEKNLLDDKLLQQQVLNIWKILEDAGVSTEKRIILKPQIQSPEDENYASGAHIDIFTVLGDHYPTEDLWSISPAAQ